MQAVETKSSVITSLQNPKKVVVIGDREIKNLFALLSLQHEQHNAALNTVGFISAGHEVDDAFINRINSLFRGKDYTAFADNDYSLEIYRDLSSTEGRRVFTYKDLPYDAKSFKENPASREAYMLQLAEHTASLKPDIVLLSNFKLILSKTFVQAFKNKIINIHPSFLPLLKGFRPEHRASNLREDVEANGYTIHLVSEELDGGPTLFQEQIDIAPYNHETEEKMGVKEYQKFREEVHRLAIINAQSQKVPHVLGLFTSDVKRKIVSDREACVAENRLDFFHSEKYQLQLRQEHEESNSRLPYALWHRLQRKPYQRVLFLDQASDQYITAEKFLFGKSKIVSQTEQHSTTPHVTYEFTVLTSKRDIVNQLYDVPYKGERRIVVHNDEEQSQVLITGEVDIDDMLRVNDIEFSKSINSVRVTAARKMPEW